LWIRIAFDKHEAEDRIKPHTEPVEAVGGKSQYGTINCLAFIPKSKLFMKMFFCCILVCLTHISLQAQDYLQIKNKIDSLKIQTSKIQNEIDSLVTAYPHQIQHSIFAEILGSGGFGSLNYDYRFSRNWSIRAGLGYFYWYTYSGSLGMYSYVQTGGSYQETNFIGSLTLPIMMNFMTNEGTSPGHFEIGIGIAPWFGNYYTRALVRRVDATGRPIGTEWSTVSNDFGVSIFLPINIGYRYQAFDDGFFFRIGANGLIGGNFGGLPWLGLSAGYSFGQK
jgi:hypothetical protein